MVAAAMTSRPVELAPEPVHGDVTWVSSYDVDPLEVPTADKAGAARRLDRPAPQPHAAVEHATADLEQVQENKFYADLSGTSTTQQRVRLKPDLRGDGHRRGDRRLRLDADASPRRPAAAGSTSPARTGTGTPRSPRCPNCWPRS